MIYLASGMSKKAELRVMVTRGWKLGNRLLLFKGYKPPTVSEGGSNYSVVITANNTVSQT